MCVWGGGGGGKVGDVQMEDIHKKVSPASGYFKHTQRKCWGHCQESTECGDCTTTCVMCNPIITSRFKPHPIGIGGWIEEGRSE